MAPTICSDKKTQIRSGIKDIRKQSTTSSLSTSPSSAINYAQKRSKLIRPYPVRGKQSNDTFRHHTSSSSDASSSDDTNERFLSPQSPLSSISDNSISTSSESSLLSPLSLSSFTSPLTASIPTEAFSPCAERLNPFYHNSDSSSSSSLVSSIGSNQDDIENDDDAISRSSSMITSDSQDTITTTISSTDKLDVRPLSMLQLQHQAKNTKGLFEIAIKTIKLVRRNQLLQRRLAQLQLETSEFIQSVLANPENRALRDKIQAKAQKRSKLIRPYPVRGKQSNDTFRHHTSSSSDASSSDDTNERFLSPQSPLSSISDNSISTSSESSLLSPLSLSSFTSPLTASIPTEAFSPCAERLNPFYHNSDSSSSSSLVSSIGSNQDDIENDDDAISRSSSMITSDSQDTITTTISSTDKLDVRPLSMLQLQHQAKNTKGLFEIAIKTIKLVRRNQLLQRRLAQLQLETSEFIQSVLANPENRALRDKIQAKGSCNREMI